jgi:hypothetical protein
VAETAVSATEHALENQRLGGLQIRVAVICGLIQMCDGTTRRGASRGTLMGNGVLIVYAMGSELSGVKGSIVISVDARSRSAPQGRAAGSDRYHWTVTTSGSVTGWRRDALESLGRLDHRLRRPSAA